MRHLREIGIGVVMGGVSMFGWLLGNVALTWAKANPADAFEWVVGIGFMALLLVGEAVQK